MSRDEVAVGSVTVSIIIPVFNKLAFTHQCLERLGRDLSGPSFEVVIVDNASTDRTRDFFVALCDDEAGTGRSSFGYPVVYVRNDTNLGFSRANNVGVARSTGRYVLFLNNDTLVTPGWLDAMVGTIESDRRIGIVGIKQLFPYTNKIHHTGIIFTADKRPQHIYPYSDGSLPHVNRQRAYQAVTGSCLLISRELFDACGQFDEGYRNGYEDIELCLQAKQHGRTVVCCTSGMIYHYGQISETRTDDDDANAARMLGRWREAIEPDELKYFVEDRYDIERPQGAPAIGGLATDPNLIYFADDLSTGSALSWVTDELIRALEHQGRAVAVRETMPGPAATPSRRQFLEKRMRPGPMAGGIQIKWSHYWPQHLNLDLNGRLNLELFVINYLFGEPGRQPWDYWLQTLPTNHYRKLPLSTFCQDVLTQVGIPAAECRVVRPGYSPEALQVAAPKRQGPALRLLTVTNSHDLERYGTRLLLDAYWSTFSRRDDVVLVVKDYGAVSGDTTIRDLIAAHPVRARVEYVTEFTSKEKLIELYKSCDAFVSAHRGEGYGMKILDALACGLPVITPHFGGPRDFCTDANTLAVPFSMVPVGDCFDTRALRITNAPLWAEPDVAALGGLMRRVADAPGEARVLGERAAADVRGRFTWDEAARALSTFIDAELAETDRRWTPVVRPPARTESSPYWMGCRVSVIVPTYNRSAMLRRCLEALSQQTILPQEFEVIVVDDGSTDDTRAVVESFAAPFRLEYVHQANAGPGAARNHGLRYAAGELVLFVGDDILADERLLEAHLEAHTAEPNPATAVLGHIDWPADLDRTSVMDYVCGPSTLQFAYTFIPTLPKLDYRFFYTSNISIKRSFLAEAAADGVMFDPCFTKAAFEDSELALRLEQRGLEIVYAGQARAFHHHWMDLDGFARRERAVGQMAVVFYRKHPQIDDMLQVRWVGDWIDAVEELVRRPELEATLAALDQQTDTFLRSLAATLDELGRLQRSLGTDVLGGAAKRVQGTSLLEATYGAIFDVARTQGKVEEWYRSVGDRRLVDAAVRLIGCVRRLEFLSTSPDEVRRLRGTIHWLSTDVVGNLSNRVGELERHLGAGPAEIEQIRLSGAATPDVVGQLNGRISTLERTLGTARMPSAGPGFTRGLVNAVRRADRRIQHELGRQGNQQWLARYYAVRRRLRQFIPPTPGAGR
jgi:GT2 family glycosyltransferase/glycosyltransferase involved in cell wall biosynthesis